MVAGFAPFLTVPNAFLVSATVTLAAFMHLTARLPHSTTVPMAYIIFAMVTLAALVVSQIALHALFRTVARANTTCICNETDAVQSFAAPFETSTDLARRVLRETLLEGVGGKLDIPDGVGGVLGFTCTKRYKAKA